jgi:hypothetical protein
MAFRWVIIPRVAGDDPILGWLEPLGAQSREFEPERYSRPGSVAYEVGLTSVHVDDEDSARAIWEAAALPEP